jgi:hypothetical protein
MKQGLGRKLKYPRYALRLTAETPGSRYLAFHYNIKALELSILSSSAHKFKKFDPIQHTTSEGAGSRGTVHNPVPSRGKRGFSQTSEEFSNMPQQKANDQQ